MYYPIIDKLKEIMADITSVKEKEPLIIEGTLTSQTTGTWSGNFSDINLSLTNKKPVYFKMSTLGTTILVPVIIVGNNNAISCVFPYYNDRSYGILSIDNTFTLKS